MQATYDRDGPRWKGSATICGRILGSLSSDAHGRWLRQFVGRAHAEALRISVMPSRQPGMGPWDFIVVGVGFAFLAGLFAVLGAVFLVWAATLVASLALMIGTVAQGVRVGMRAHQDDRLIEKIADDAA